MIESRYTKLGLVEIRELVPGDEELLTLAVRTFAGAGGDAAGKLGYRWVFE